MIISEERYCIASKDFPLRFYDRDGCELNVFNHHMLMTKQDCEYELGMFDEPEEFQILKVKATYEF